MHIENIEDVQSQFSDMCDSDFASEQEVVAPQPLKQKLTVRMPTLNFDDISSMNDCFSQGLSPMARMNQKVGQQDELPQDAYRLVKLYCKRLCKEVDNESQSRLKRSLSGSKPSTDGSVFRRLTINPKLTETGRSDKNLNKQRTAVNLHLNLTKLEENSLSFDESKSSHEK